MTHVASIHKEILLCLAGYRFRFDNKSPDGHQIRISLHLYKSRSIHITFRIAENRLDALFLSSYRQLQQYLIIVHKRKSRFGINQHNMIELCQQIA